MKNNQLIITFLFLCLLSALLSMFLIYRYNSILGKMRDLQPKLAQAQTGQSMMQAMIGDTAEYNKTARNPDIARMLQPYMNPVKAVKPPAK